MSQTQQLAFNLGDLGYDPTLLDSTYELEGVRVVRRMRLGDREWTSYVEFPEMTDDDRRDPAGAWWRAYLLGKRPKTSNFKRPTLRFAEIFCGPGGLALGFRQACNELGLDAVSIAAADQDAGALQVYQRRNETQSNHVTARSVSELVEYELDGRGEQASLLFEPEILEDVDWPTEKGSIDVLLAGPPCQGHSNLNNHTRRDDERNELYLTAPAMAIALDAKVVIIENVRAVLHDKRQVVQSSISILEAAGYKISEGVIKAVDLGWPQTRERYFVIAHRDVQPIRTTDISWMLREDQPRSLWWAISDLENADTDDYRCRPPEFSEDNIRRIDYLHDNDEHDLPLHERPDCHVNGTTYGAVYGRLYRNKPAPTITTGFMTPGRGRYIHPTQRRVITAHEAARLQGFPDDYNFHLSGGEEPTKAMLAKWIGDAVPVPLGYAASLAALLPDTDLTV